ncbi:MAG: hypothetical protein WCP29_05295 [Acidobacteriota bacterium]
MKVEHGLAGRLANVDPNVEPVWRVSLSDGHLRGRDRLDELNLLVGRRVEPARYVPPSRQQRVSRRDRVGIPQTEDPSAVVEDAVLGDVAERALRHRAPSTE